MATPVGMVDPRTEWYAIPYQLVRARRENRLILLKSRWARRLLLASPSRTERQIEEKKMRKSWFYAVYAAGLVAAGGARAQDADAAHKLMHEAMHDATTMPGHGATLPDHTGPGHDAMPGAGAGMERERAMKEGLAKESATAATHRAMNRGKAAEAVDAARHRAMHQGSKDAAASHVEAASRAGMGAAMGTGAMGAGGAMHDAADKARMTGMHGGMMGGTPPGGIMGGTGPGGMMGGTPPGGAGTGTMPGGTGTGTMPGGTGTPPGGTGTAPGGTGTMPGGTGTMTK